MIRKIDIQKYGIFSGYSWDKSIGQDKFFHRLNIIYGRNYAGKTTLSRILRSLEANMPNPDFSDGQFVITLADNIIIKNDDLGKALTHKVRVYNSDFVKENLSWFYNSDGTIKPFTIIGAKNVEIAQRLELIEDILGSVEKKTGLFYEQHTLQTGWIKIKKYASEKSDSLDERLRKKAKNIKNNSLYHLPIPFRVIYCIYFIWYYS
ncbi:MAG: AAA family ATPase [Candidatus Kapaibacteriota bacterium]